MGKALMIAEYGRLRVEPNPVVGAVVLDRRGEWTSWGFHPYWGGPHAEVEALRRAGARARGGTLIVTLEPCAHAEKKTPPCVPAVVASGVKRVVVGARDPNPATTGRAARALRAAGIEYRSGVLAERCRASIARYAEHVGRRRPWTIAKWATSLDGRIADADGASRWVSGKRAREIVRLIRSRCDAVIVGRGTVEADDPSLTTERGGPRATPPIRVVFDSRLRTPTSARLVATARETPTLFVAVRGAPAKRRRALESAGALVLDVRAGKDRRVDVVAAFRALHRLGVRRAMLEAGGTLQAACLRAGVVDQVTTFVAPVVLGGGGPTPFDGVGWPIADAPRLEHVRISAVGKDAMIEGYWPRGVGSA
jgi:diaminohydroxyphosphoribosylaminopyrimidine deaminase/5-amino-6-(5-phosphoribosylamino)uracil reductase